jgi:hypothetical protein
VKDMMYSNEDIKEMMERLKGIVSENMESEISYYLNMNGNIFI